MEPQILRPKHKTLELRGKMSYSESIRAWNTIRFRKALAQEFSDLQEKRALFSYKAIMYQTYPELEKAIKKMKAEDSAIPILLFLVKEKESND